MFRVKVTFCNHYLEKYQLNGIHLPVTLLVAGEEPWCLPEKLPEIINATPYWKKEKL